MLIYSQFHKTGVLYGSNGDWVVSYEGEWERGQMNGKGLIHFDNGTAYRGSFLNGMVRLGPKQNGAPVEFESS